MSLKETKQFNMVPKSKYKKTSCFLLVAMEKKNKKTKKQKQKENQNKMHKCHRAFS